MSLLAEDMEQLGIEIREKLPKELGFMLITFPFGGNGIASYVSSGNREDMINFLEETIETLKKRGDFPTPSNKAN